MIDLSLVKLLIILSLYTRQT